LQEEALAVVVDEEQPLTILRWRRRKKSSGL
jgi:hypothetical protein